MGVESFDERASQRAKELVGRVLDERYQIDRILAMGGMGTVYAGRHLKLKKRVALKVLHPGAEDHPELFMRFEREALAGAQVNHPNVAAATDFGELDDGTRFLVMEYVRGRTLRSVLDSDAPLDVVRSARIARQIAVALGEIHDKGIVHRDMKPRNVMLGHGEIVKIVDFGLAKIDGARVSTMSINEDDDGNRLTEVGSIFGTVEYLAPEAALGMEMVDGRADLYALGVVLYEMLTGKHPFDGGNDVEFFAEQRLKPVPPFAHRAPSVIVPDALEAVTMKLLAKGVADRYQTAADVVAALDAAIPDASVSPIDSAVPSSGALSSRPVPLSDPPPPKSARESSGKAAPSSKRAKPREDKPPSTRRSKDAPVARRDPIAEPTTKDAPRGSGGTLAIVGIAALAVVALYAATQAKTPAEPTAAPPPVSASATSSSTPSSAPAVVLPSPSAPAAQSAQASASVSVEAPEPLLDPNAMTEIAAQIKDGKLAGASAAALGLLRQHPTLVEDKTAASVIRKLLGALVQKQHASKEEVFRAVGTTQRTAGPDFLYKLVETGGKAALASEAIATLHDDAVAKETSAAAKIALQLRLAQCGEKIALIDRAVAEGDQRALVVLDIQARGCTNDGARIDAALDALKKRLGTPAR